MPYHGFALLGNGMTHKRVNMGGIFFNRFELLSIEPVYRHRVVRELDLDVLLLRREDFYFHLTGSFV